MLHSWYSKAENMKREIPVFVGDQTSVVKPAACQYTDSATFFYFILYLEKFMYRKSQKNKRRRRRRR